MATHKAAHVARDVISLPALDRIDKALLALILRASPDQEGSGPDLRGIERRLAVLIQEDTAVGQWLRGSADLQPVDETDENSVSAVFWSRAQALEARGLLTPCGQWRRAISNAHRESIAAALSEDPVLYSICAPETRLDHPLYKALREAPEDDPSADEEAAFEAAGDAQREGADEFVTTAELRRELHDDA